MHVMVCMWGDVCGGDRVCVCGEWKGLCVGVV